MKLFLRRFLTGCILLYSSSLYAFSSITPDQTLWFQYPATNWSKQTLHLGNGFMGASFYGGVEKERLDIAEKTFWAGGPNVSPNYHFGNITGGKDQIALIREKIKNHEFKAADSLCRKYMTGNFSNYGYFSTVGNLEIDFNQDSKKATDYVRGLDLSNSTGFVQYKYEGVTYNREYLCSYPDKILALHLTANAKNKVAFKLSHILTYKPDKIVKQKDELIYSGLITANGLRYSIRMKVVQSGGTVTVGDDGIRVINANEASIYYTVDTEYKYDYPSFKGEHPDKNTESVMKVATFKGYEKLKSNHIADYQNLYNRVKLTLKGDSVLEKKPTNERVEELKKGSTDDASLKALWFNLSRYLVISASRPGTLPSTLQGVWNTFESAPWGGNFQSNINLEEMYWGCGSTNLPECQESYIEWIEGLVKPGRITAETYYGTKGWVSNATGNIWGFTAPGSDILWGIYPSANAWHSRNLWEQYLFTGDKAYLKNRAYPVMKEAAEFWLENMVEYKGRYIIAPTVSAEHGVEMKGGKPVDYSTVNGEVYENKALTIPAYQDIEMVYDLYTNVIEASAALNIDADLRGRIMEIRDKLMPLKIGKYGQLQEWILDADNPRDHHRHMAHLYALYPGNMITLDKTDDLAQAAKKSLEMRGEGVQGTRWPHAGGNWSMAWKSALWNRLKDGDRAIRIFNTMIKDCGYENMLSNQSGNVMMDAPMATCGIFAEMLLQSQNGYLDILPALPTEWPEGKVEGLVARNGYTVNIEWKYGNLVKAVIKSSKGALLPRIQIKGVDLKKGDRRIAFEN
ncbi:glycosyl hydrolase family 95 catalytic domain-containing protein [Pedobacter nutrimenti]|uniref:glycosyl hydrolase family 95 catalytic domain-containing protein n=1 Tax=Pedobacter nutrimenti TaxID=1241337 RepID=UPI00292D3966|nr:glycoside hydrolase N-terminal domain-containing protein [Pedobacter nutrimenti]